MTCPGCDDTGWIEGNYCNCIEGDMLRRRDMLWMDRLLDALASVDEPDPDQLPLPLNVEAR